MSIFDSIKLGKGKRNSFDLSHNVKLSCDMGQLIPIMCEEVLPDDTFKVQSDVMCRFAPLVSPIMHDVDLFVHYFYCPNRLIWSLWREFITGGDDGKEAPSFPRVRVPEAYTYPGSLLDYLGFPTQQTNENNEGNVSNVVFNALPFRAYNLIWNEYYRDQNLQPEIDIQKEVSGLHIPSAYTADSGTGEVEYTAEEAVERFFSVKNRAWEKDYFTSALPWTQRGEAVRLPLAGQADITALSSSPLSVPVSGNARLRVYNDNDDGSNTPPSLGQEVITTSDSAGNGQVGLSAGSSTGSLLGVNLAPDYGAGSSLHGDLNVSDVADRLKADMTTVTSTTINELRRSYALQRWLERNAFGGSRYIEQIFSHFGVKSSDARLQRPEYLGGGRCPVRISQVLQTSETSEDSALGSMAGHGLAVGRSNKFKKYFEEHGWVIGILSVVPRSGYFQGIPRKFSKFDKLDYAWPEFAHLGEQEVKNKEIFMDYAYGTQTESGGDNYNNAVFGYQSRYVEYKQLPNRVCGDFRSTLDFWHLARRFNKTPVLNGDFIQVKPEFANRIWAVNNYVDEETGEEKPINHLWIQINHRIKALRQLPYYGTPI